MNRQHLPDSSPAAMHDRLRANLAELAKRPDIQLIGKHNLSRRSEIDPALSALEERARPRVNIPPRLVRGPLKWPRLGQLFLRGWNFLSREWRDIAGLSRQALLNLHARFDEFEGTALTHSSIKKLEARISELESQLRTVGVKREASPLSHKETTAFLERVAQRFRGDPVELRERLHQHLSKVQAACAGVADKPILDLGCGHGEWLALMRDAGLAAYGVDFSPECLDICQAQGLDARYGDAMQALDDATPEGLAVVSAFQLVEHLPLEAQIALFAKAYAALAPGGLLIVETPNPESAIVMNGGFWCDPTHSRPLPAQLLGVFAETAGFLRVESRAINPPEAPEIELLHYPPRQRHYLFCGRDTVVYAWK